MQEVRTVFLTFSLLICNPTLPPSGALEGALREKIYREGIDLPRRIIARMDVILPAQAFCPTCSKEGSIPATSLGLAWHQHKWDMQEMQRWDCIHSEKIVYLWLTYLEKNGVEKEGKFWCRKKNKIMDRNRRPQVKGWSRWLALVWKCPWIEPLLSRASGFPFLLTLPSHKSRGHIRTAIWLCWNVHVRKALWVGWQKWVEQQGGILTGWPLPVESKISLVFSKSPLWGFNSWRTACESLCWAGGGNCNSVLLRILKVFRKFAIHRFFYSLLFIYLFILNFTINKTFPFGSQWRTQVLFFSFNPQ